MQIPSAGKLYSSSQGCLSQGIKGKVSVTFQKTVRTMHTGDKEGRAPCVSWDVSLESPACSPSICSLAPHEDSE